MMDEQGAYVPHHGAPYIFLRVCVCVCVYVCVCVCVLLCEYGVLSKRKAICTVTAAVSRSASLCALCFIDFLTPGIKTVPKTKHHVTVSLIARLLVGHVMRFSPGLPLPTTK